jgi:hypothetical protein
MKNANVMDLPVRKPGKAAKAAPKAGHVDTWRGGYIRQDQRGRACYEEGFNCLLVPSARLPGQSNVVIFPHRLKKTRGSVVAAGIDDRRKEEIAPR